MDTDRTDENSTSQRRVLAPRPPGARHDAPPGTRNGAEGYGSRPGKRRRVACQLCRQSKLRCEGSTNVAEPCQRCSDLDQPCVFDSKFKRVSKRTTLSDLANHVEMLKTASGLNRQESQPLTSQTPGRDSEPTTTPKQSRQPPQDWIEYAPREFRAAGNSSQPGQSLAQATARNDAEGPPDMLPSYATSTPRAIKAVALTPDQITQFFRIYFASYHPAFPVLSVSISPDKIYQSSPLLFWTIIVTASRHDGTDPSLLQTLIPEVKGLLWATIAAVPHTLLSLQAMSILCVWTFPVSSMPLDITFMLCGILKSAATHVGLHRPENLSHYSRTRIPLGQSELCQVAKVWCCIFLAIESVAVGTGHPPFLPDDVTIQRATEDANPYDLPEEVHTVVAAQSFCNKVHVAFGETDWLDNSRFSSRRSALLDSFESDLRRIQNRPGRPSSHKEEVYILSAGFQLWAYSIFDDEDTADRRQGVLRAFDRAILFIDVLKHGAATGRPVKYLTLLEIRICFAAVVFISKVFHSSYGQYVDGTAVRGAFSFSISIFKECSIEDNDTLGRMTKVLSQLWGIYKSLFDENPECPPRLSLKTRSFFSISHDALWQWREKYAGQPSNGAPDLPPPVISAASTADSNPSDEQEHAPETAQDKGLFDCPASSALDRQQINPASQFDTGSAQDPWVSTADQDEFLTGTELIDPDATQYDLLYSGLFMSPDGLSYI